MRTLTILLIAASIAVITSCSRNKEGDNYTHVKSEDAEMSMAIEKAKATKDDFLKAFHSKNLGTKDYFVKKPFPTPSGSVEHMWVEVIEEERGIVKGYVANEAEETQQVKLGQAVSLQMSEISDWKYQDGKKLIGGFTIRYFAERMSQKEREAFFKEAGFEF